MSLCLRLRRHLAVGPALWLLFATGLATACSQSPTEAYTEMSTSALLGDRDGFLDGFTKDSRKLVKALISLSEAYGFRKQNPFELLVFDAVEREEVSEDGKKAVLFVRTKNRKRKVLMVLEDDAWRIDTQELASYWKENKRRWD